MATVCFAQRKHLCFQAENESGELSLYFRGDRAPSSLQGITERALSVLLPSKGKFCQLLPGWHQQLITSDKIQLKKAETVCKDLSLPTLAWQARAGSIAYHCADATQWQIVSCQTRPSESTSSPQLSKSPLAITLYDAEWTYGQGSVRCHKTQETCSPGTHST